MASRNIKLTLSYDGSDYRGWQIQPGYRTIQQTLNEAIETLVGFPVRVTGASRTDAGVSALGQVAIFQIESPIPTENFVHAITHQLPKDIAVTDAVEVPFGFNVIGGVTNKLYRYTIFTGKLRPVLTIRNCWHFSAALDVEAMDKSAKVLVGKKDFKSFASAADQRENSTRTIFRCDVTSEKDLIYINVEGDGFLYNMVRNIVGTLVDAGRGRCDPEKMKKILDAKDRAAAGPIAPAAGLCLMWIEY